MLAPFSSFFRCFSPTIFFADFARFILDATPRSFLSHCAFAAEFHSDHPLFPTLTLIERLRRLRQPCHFRRHDADAAASFALR